MSTFHSLLALPLLLAAGCGQMAVDGEIVDVAGNPVAGARITTLGTPCTAVSGEDGRFAMPCPPGSYSLAITHDGYIQIDQDLDALERKRYDLGKLVMVAIPPADGLFWFKDNQYQTLHAGLLDRTIDNGEGGTKNRRYCLDGKRSEANELAAGTHAFFDNHTAGWRPFLLDAEGCAYRDSQDATGRWEVSYKEKPQFEERTLEQGRKIAAIELPPGDYFIADWDQGFFTPTDTDDGKRYTGFWLVVR